MVSAGGPTCSTSTAETDLDSDSELSVVLNGVNHVSADNDDDVIEDDAIEPLATPLQFL